MNCHCGGSTKDHEVQRDSKIIAEFRRCIACGKISWLWGETDLKHYDFDEIKHQAELLSEP